MLDLRLVYSYVQVAENVTVLDGMPLESGVGLGLGLRLCELQPSQDGLPFVLRK